MCTLQTGDVFHLTARTPCTFLGDHHSAKEKSSRVASGSAGIIFHELSLLFNANCQNPI